LNHRLGGLDAIGWIAEIGIDVKHCGFEVGHVVAAFVIDFEHKMGGMPKKQKTAISSCEAMEGALAQTLED
jgi:hypothetical protein